LLEFVIVAKDGRVTDEESALLEGAALGEGSRLVVRNKER
jgi:hypothetical protein